MTVYESTKEMAQKKLAKFDKFFDENAEMTVCFSLRNNQEIVEITIRTAGLLFRAEEGNATFANAIDHAVEALERQIRKNKTRLEKRLRSGAFDPVPGDIEEEEEGEFQIRTKYIPVKPMSVEEAILQMNLLEHQFFVFRDAETEKPAVVYRRKNGDYGLITEE